MLSMKISKLDDNWRRSALQSGLSVRLLRRIPIAAVTEIASTNIFMQS